jgi:serine/threonine protein kinase
MYYIIEYCPQGDLFQLINSNPSGLGEKTGKILFRQVAESINYLHSLGFAHGDIRLENFVIGEDKKVKMIDFEFIKPVSALSNEFNGSNYYMAPEILKHEEFLPEKADVFAAGCVLFSLVFGRPAFREATRDIGLYKKFCNTPTVFWQDWERATNINVSSDLKDLLENMLIYDPSQRLSISSVLSHSALN